MSGWIKLHRSFSKWEWYDQSNCVSVFTDLLLGANFEDGKYRGVNIPKGSLTTSYGKIAERTGLTVQQVRTVLQKLKSTNEITIKTTNLFTMISITNWDKYQTEYGADNKPITNKQQTDNKQVTTSKNLITQELNNERSITIKPSPLSFLFNHMPEVQDWLNSGNHDTHLILTSKFSHHVLAQEIPKLFTWASKKDVRAESWMHTKLLNVDTLAFTPIQAQKPFSAPHTIQSLTSEEIELLKAAGQI